MILQNYVKERFKKLLNINSNEHRKEYTTMYFDSG